MERITIKGKWQDGLSGEQFCYRYKEYNNGHINKLGLLEDYEEEIGVDLITLFKAKNNGFFVKLAWINNGKSTMVLGKEIDDINLTRCLIFDKVYGFFVCFKDYGKTWALTREELGDK